VKWSLKCCLLILTAILIAIALRLPQLDKRPLHGDEAVHGVKFGLLLEKGFYQYDTFEYHGPTLNYFTFIPAWLSSNSKFSDLSEFTLRIVPVFFGVLLVLIPFLLVNYFSLSASTAAALLTAISPAMVYYSRYYIQEILLVCFTFGVIAFGFLYSQKKQFRWVLLTGIFLGLMHATKETSIILFGSLLIALGLTYLMRRKKKDQPPPGKINSRKIVWHCMAAVAIAAIVSALFYSSFFTNPGGISDSYKTYITYFDRGTQNDWHIHPWYFYIKILIYSKFSQGPLWSEALIFILAIVGIVATMSGKGVSGIHTHLIRFITFFTLLVMVIYSLIPYKTPWNLLGFLYGLILLAGVGFTTIVKLQPKIFYRRIVISLLAIGGIQLLWQAHLANYKYYSDPVNPYVYAHTGENVYTIVQQIVEISNIHPDGSNMYIQVFCPNNDYWPLPWYLRSFPNIGWWDKINEDVPVAPLIIISPSMEQDLIKRLYEYPPPGEKHLYVPLFSSYKELRPGVELRCYVRKDLWDQLR